MTAIYEDALVLPPRGNVSGVYRGGEVVRESLLFRHHAQIDFPVAYSGEIRPVDMEAIYCGRLPDHYGHFLLEGLARLWYARGRPDLPLLWGTHRPSLLPFQQEILDLLRVPNPVILCTVPSRIAALHVPEPGFVIRNRFLPEQAEALGCVDPGSTEPGMKLYLSRSKGENFGGAANEPELEEALAREGWTIAHPQEHGVAEQLRLLARAEDILAIEGSALHSMILLRNVRGRVTIIPRPFPVNANYATIAAGKGIRQRYLEQDGLYSDVRGEEPRTTGKLEVRTVLGRLADLRARNAAPMERVGQLPSYRAWVEAHIPDPVWTASPDRSREYAGHFRR